MENSKTVAKRILLGANGVAVSYIGYGSLASNNARLFY